MPKRLRVLVAAPYFFPKNYGGAVQVYHQLLRDQDQLETTVVAPEAPDMREALAFDKAAPARFGYRVVRIGRFEHIVPAGTSRMRALGDAVRFLAVTWTEWRRVLRQIRPDIVLCGGTFAAGWLMRALPRHSVFLNYIHGEELTLPVSGPVRRYLYRQQFRALRRADLNIVVSQYSARIARQISGAAESSFVVHPNFVDTNLFRPPVDRDALRLGLGWQDRFVLLTVARLTPRKGVDHALRALSQANARGKLPPNWLYAIGGVGLQEAELRELCSSLELTEHVRFLGFMQETTMPDFYGAADIFLLPNRVVNGDFEGFGLVFLEANACGTAVIGGRDGGSADAIVNGETGLLVDGQSVGEIRDAIESLVGCFDLRVQMGKRGLLRARTDFTLDAARVRFTETLRRTWDSLPRGETRSAKPPFRF